MPKASLLIIFSIVIISSIVGASRSGSSAVDTVSFKGFSLQAKQDRDILSMEERFLGLSKRYLNAQSGSEEMAEAVRQIQLDLSSGDIFNFDQLFQESDPDELSLIQLSSLSEQHNQNIADLSLVLSEGVSLSGGYRFDQDMAGSHFTNSLDEGAHQIRLGLTFELK